MKDILGVSFMCSLSQEISVERRKGLLVYCAVLVQGVFHITSGRDLGMHKPSS